MKLSGESSSRSSQKKNARSGLRFRKKQKRLDAICEKEFNRNHGELNEGDGGGIRSMCDETDVRRSSRVRRAPVLLDASPSLPKKRRMLVKNVKLSCGKSAVSPVGVNQKPADVESAGAWSSRLRARGRSVGFVVKEEKVFSSRKRRLFKEANGNLDDQKVEAAVNRRKEEFDEVLATVVRSKRPGSIKAPKHLGERHNANTSNVNLEQNVSEEVKLSRNEDQKTDSVSEVEMVNKDSIEIVNDEATPTIDREDRETPTSMQLEEVGANVNIENIEDSVKHVEGSGCVKEDDERNDVIDIIGVPGNQLDDLHLDGVDDNEGKTLQDEDIMKMDRPKHVLDSMPGGARIKEGRRCSLCGGGIDGKPPKKFVDENGESENEAYSGSPASDEPNYDIWDGFGDEPGWLGRLLGPINDRYGIAGIWVHQHCAVWSPEVYFAGLGCLKNVRAALCRGRALKCTRCGRRGATIGCRVDRCPKTYHLPCARANGCIFDHRKFLIACTDHRHLFQPYGNKYLAQMKKLKVRKMKLELRKLSNDASRKDVETEEKWLENCGEDEEFLKRESKRLHRDLLRIAPEYIGGSESENKDKFQGWESIAGLKDVIRCMKEVVILPLLYPEFFDSMGLTPPRGVLLHGYPGTGKTLVVRALIGACARGDKRISYFARKGADCLGKYVGDAERQLRLLFQVAEKCQPSIIFFDEIDGLAPSRTRHQDQTHNSVVSTLLALLDGLKSRGSVVVIGATNRPDAVDPALRRPGRFDREIYFPLPSVDDRAAILALHTQKWPKPIAGPLLEWIARRTAGFAGADLQALCTQAAINALKRNFPLHEVLSSAVVNVHKSLPLPTFSVEERDWLEAMLSSPPPCSRREAGNAANDVECSSLQIHLLPCLLRPLCNLLISLFLDDRISLPPSIVKAALTIKSRIVSQLDIRKMPLDQWWLHVDDFLQKEDIAAEISAKLIHLSVIVGDDSFGGSHAFLDGADNVNINLEFFEKHNSITHTCLLQNTSASTGKAGVHILIAGSSKSGQRHLASCLLNCFVGNVEIQKVDAATISLEGRGDMVLGIAQLLIRCASVRSCVIFMPRIDLWAIEMNSEIANEKESCVSHIHNIEQENRSGSGQNNISEPRKDQETLRTASYTWISFIEQFESIGVKTSLMVLATSDVPFPELPHRVREFFKHDGLSGNSLLTTSNYKVPCFTVQIDENFDHDMVINFSASELSRDIVKQMVQVIHQRTHVQCSPCKEYRTDSMEADMERVRDKKNDCSANGYKDRMQCHGESLTKLSQQPRSKSLKGKSNLLLAISSFGYQILLYPHFAELCWITSKLKEGPSADASGPWKGWPFNSCIVRPNKVDMAPAACGTGNMKTKEKPGLVRGLVAVGLSAYRGVYTSVKEVSLEIRKVLELVVEQINTRIQGGNERHEYIRVLSQVAYLEDMVNSWAHGLLSLDPDSQGVEAKHVPTSEGSLYYNRSCFDKPVELEGFQLTIPVEMPLDPMVLKDNSQEINTREPECCELNNRSDGSNDDHLEDRVVNSHASPNEQNDSSTAVEQFIGEIQGDVKITNFVGTKPFNDEFQNEVNREISRSNKSQDSENQVADKDFRPSKESNGFANHQEIFLDKYPLHVSCEIESAQFGNSSKMSNQVSRLPLLENGIKGSDVNSDANENAVNISSDSTGVPAESGALCMYQCCPECLCTLYGLIQKILTKEMRLHGSHWTAEDVHDVVTSSSINLASSVRKACLAEDLNEISALDLKCSKQGTKFPDSRRKELKFSGRVGVPVECTFRSTASSGSIANHTQLKLDSKFIFRDGTLVHLDVDKDASFHCKFETLCLCPLIKSIEMTKHPFD